MRYTIYRFKPDGMDHGWKEEQSDTIPDPEGTPAVSVPVWDRWAARQDTVYVVDSKAKGNS